MKEYIEREAIEKMLENAQIITCGEYCGYCTEDVNLGRIPAADVAPVRHGRWIELSRTSKCSGCGFETGRYEPARKFCPACGCCMIGDDEHDTVSNK